ncbi:MAG: ABC transporter substrate-binding protein [Treponema sp.]|nr:ABC transporter substrate-binding protein [Treponema sp.]
MKKVSIISIVFCILIVFCIIFTSCPKHDEYTSDWFEGFDSRGLEELLAKTTTKPWTGQEFQAGKIGGTWNTAMIDDPKSFNILVAEQDSSTKLIVSRMIDYLMDYDAVARQWKPRIASPQIIINESNNTMQVVFTLRDDLYWSYYNSNRKVKVTSDDVIFWYNEIEGDPVMESSGYYGQFINLPDGSEGRITISKIDELRFAFHFPIVLAEPLLALNMDFGPRHIYEPAKRSGGAEAVRNLHNISVNPQTIPSMGEWFLVEYTPGQRIVYKRNPDYWRKDSNDISIPYREEMIIRIIPDETTRSYLFLEGNIDTYSLRPEDINPFLEKDDGTFTIFNSEGSLSSNFWTFNQNPINSDKPQYEWFTKKEFRQAMSCLLHRERINIQVYRGLAQPMLYIFPEPNPYYNPAITLQYLFDTRRAINLLSSIGIKRDSSGIMRDDKGRQIEFDLTIGSDRTIIQDTASIIMDELSKVGIKVNIRVISFQLQVQQIFETYEWDSMIIGLSGSGIFPSQGSNTWRSSGNLHMWYPNQPSPATEWEARIDYLYNEGLYTLDKTKAKEIWDEFQSILLEQCPLIYLMRPRSFWGLNNRWDFSNVYFDNINNNLIDFIYLK